MAGKGSKPRSCFSKQFKSNYDQINWHAKPNGNKRNPRRTRVSTQK